MKILVVVTLHPPLHAGTYDHRCATICDRLAQRGHQVHVLTSTWGLQSEQRDEDLSRRLRLNGAFGAPQVKDYAALEALELHNHAVLRETLAEQQPSLVQVFSLVGLSKSLIFTLHKAGVPHAFDVPDGWLCPGLRDDPWLAFWNSPAANVRRSSLELTGRRNRLDATAPTRLTRGYDRVPELYGPEVKPPPGGLGAFKFDRISFVSPWLKERAEAAGFRVQDAAITPPGADTQISLGEIKPPAAPVQKLLWAGALDDGSGLETLHRALGRVRRDGGQMSLTVYGRGESDLVARLRSLAIRELLQVQFLTPNDQARDLAGVLRQHDAFVYTREEPEPWPRFLAEAMACGLPVVCAELGGASALVAHDHNGLTFRPGDEAQLAARLKELAGDGERRLRLAEAAQAHVDYHLNESRIMDATEQFLEGT
ncbi:MAG TPA: glycosyltransferase family 4 protein, partial [Verrucomicrobiota bacterium]|nr:glycosyltransferase family 4 protein [Verrucomicrobiota bacterium]